MSEISEGGERVDKIMILSAVRICLDEIEREFVNEIKLKAWLEQNPDKYSHHYNGEQPHPSKVERLGVTARQLIKNLY
jgi:hypothetical protein